MREGVVLVVARPRDDGVAELTHCAGTREVAVVEPRDLSRPGWRYVANAPEELVIIAGERRVRAFELAAVVMRLVHIGETDLPHIVPEDRGYVAAESEAFLRAALAWLTCPVFNRPTATSLNGPYWRAEQWRAAALSAGIPASPLVRHLDPGSPQTVDGVSPDVDASVVVIGDQCVGSDDSRLRGYARDLASAAGVSLLSVSFKRDGERWCFLDASTQPPITHGVAAVLLRTLGKGRALRLVA